MWILQTADTPPLTFRLSPGTVKTVGRAPGANFIVDTATVSRLHCQLTADEERLEVIDLDSTNGTFVNDERITRRAVAIGDRLRVGRVEFGVAKEE
jgi:pSer/pThr/pTyr-binding forkhead associated (FHA) protein